MKTINWRAARIAGSIWRGLGKTWIKGQGDENYRQMVDEQQLTVALGDPQGESVWVRCTRQDDDTLLLTVIDAEQDARHSAVLFSKVLGRHGLAPDADAPGAGDAMKPADDQRLANFRAVVTAQLQRIEGVLTVRLQLLQADVQRLEVRLKALEDARDKAREVFGQIASGKDSAAEQRLARHSGRTFCELAAEYLERHAKPCKKDWRNDALIIKRKLTKLRNIPAHDVSRSDVRAVIEVIADNGHKVLANRTLALINRIFKFAVERDWRPDNPCLGLPFFERTEASDV